VAPGIYTDSANYDFTIKDVKLLLISREGPDQTIIQGRGEHGHGLPIHVQSESAIVGFLFRDFDNTFMSIQDVNAGVLANCRFGGHTHGDSIAIRIAKSSVILRDIVGLNGGGVEVKNYVWPEIDYLIRVENSTFANNHSRALSVEDGRLQVRDSNFENNQSAWGAAIYLSSVEAVIENSRFRKNRTTGFGGAIRSDNGDLLIVDSHFENNVSGGDGGAIRSYSDDLVIVDSYFESNASGGNGGAIYVSSDLSVAIDGLTFSRNRAEASGGALYWGGGSDKTITSSRFSNNQASEGGGVYFAGAGEKDVINSIFVGNRADMRGGAISAYVAWERHFRLINSTMFGNELLSEDPMALLQGSGAYVHLDWDSEAIILNSIIWNEGQGLVLDNVHQPELVSVSFNNIGPDANPYSGINNLNVNPMLRPDGLLLAGSPMIDTGTAVGAPVTDVHGETRPHGGDVDIGADEFVDTDGQGMPDWWQLHFFGSLGQDPNANPDGDGLTNIEEYVFATDPMNPDTSGNGILDGHSPYDDHNWDGIPSWLAILIGLDPYETDHVGNGVSNFEALAFGADPFDPEEDPGQQLLPHDPANAPTITLHEPVNATPLN